MYARANMLSGQGVAVAVFATVQQVKNASLIAFVWIFAPGCTPGGAYGIARYVYHVGASFVVEVRASSGIGPTTGTAALPAAPGPCHWFSGPRSVRTGMHAPIILYSTNFLQMASTAAGVAVGSVCTSLSPIR